MRLTQYTDYSFRVLIHLALSSSVVTIREISEAYGVSRNHLMKVVQQLSRAGYVESLRGQGGGLRLKKSPDDITIGDVVRDMEPDIALVECQKDEKLCVISPACRLKGLMEKSKGAFFDELDKSTLRDLLPRSAREGLVTLLSIE